MLIVVEAILLRARVVALSILKGGGDSKILFCDTGVETRGRENSYSYLQF